MLKWHLVDSQDFAGLTSILFQDILIISEGNFIAIKQ